MGSSTRTIPEGISLEAGRSAVERPSAKGLWWKVEVQVPPEKSAHSRKAHVSPSEVGVDGSLGRSHNPRGRRQQWRT